ncbi:peroxisomal leader peptide-processing protease [Hemiscyllium ocellatum]|uniref:peroxisomal leader peptide-processing protease n=1 Tax=Hemiscyllium ocellatum TaxID=170820 RepID=UPI0029668C57|nr:peroxisomal leader peptide-processing protease [Hemiscyllium ocellatum]
MFSPESCSCVVSAGLRSGAGTPGAWDWDGARSCSGLLLDPQRGLLLCHAQILSPFLGQGQLLSRQPFLLPGAYHRELQIRVQFPASNPSPGSPTPSEPVPDAPSPDLHPEVPPSGAARSQGTSPATLLVAFPCPAFWEAFQSVYQEADRWHFHLDDQEADLDGLFWFGLLHCPSWAGGAQAGETLPCVRSEHLRKGQTLLSCASPFASLWSEVFMNTFSKGIVSNLAGERNAVILTDARCLPGTEGGGVYLELHGLYYLAGVIVAPLCWKAQEWVGLTLVCSITCILKAARRIWGALGKNGKIVSFCPLSGHLPVPSPRWQGDLTRLLGSVALLECDGVWGSGVVVSPRLILTCRHVLGWASAVQVTIRPGLGSRLTLKGRVLFATKENSAYDVAVVELEEDLLYVEIPVAASGFNKGEDVCVIAYGVFGQSCGPSVTAGVLSAVVTVDQQPAMLQTTCAVHAGASGGPVFRTSSGELLGIVSSNAQNNRAGASYPHLNFSLPITVLQPLLARYNQTRNAAVFEQLNQVNDRLRALWRLQDGFSNTQRSKL